MILIWGFPSGTDGKECTCNAGELCSIPGLGRSPGEGNGYLLQYSGLDWRIPWTEEPGRLQCMGSQRVRRDWGTFTYLLNVKLPSKVILCLPVYFLGNAPVIGCFDLPLLKHRNEVTEMNKSLFSFACLSDYSFCNCPHNLEFY